MKVEALKKILKEAVREVFQEELKEVLYESFKSGKTVVQEAAPVAAPQASPKDRAAIRESYMNVLGDMQKQFTTNNVSQADQPLQVTSIDTMSPNGQLPQGSVSMDQIMGLMNK